MPESGNVYVFSWSGKAMAMCLTCARRRGDLAPGPDRPAAARTSVAPWTPQGGGRCKRGCFEDLASEAVAPLPRGLALGQVTPPPMPLPPIKPLHQIPKTACFTKSLKPLGFV